MTILTFDDECSVILGADVEFVTSLRHGQKLGRWSGLNVRM